RRRALPRSWLAVLVAVAFIAPPRASAASGPWLPAPEEDLESPDSLEEVGPGLATGWIARASVAQGQLRMRRAGVALRRGKTRGELGGLWDPDPDRGGAGFWSFAGVPAGKSRRVGAAGFTMSRGRSRASAAFAVAAPDSTARGSPERFGSITVARHDRLLATGLELLAGGAGRGLLA